MSQRIKRNPEVIIHQIADDGVFPGNEQLPLIIIQAAVEFRGEGDPGFLEELFSENGWEGSWRNGIYPFHHYHSTAHEVLGVYQGRVRAQFGGENGPVLQAESGDIIVIPAGVAHKNLWSSHDFRVVGAYPAGQSWDMNYGKEAERPGADHNIDQVPLPGSDPVYGTPGILLEHWK